MSCYLSLSPLGWSWPIPQGPAGVQAETSTSSTFSYILRIYIILSIFFNLRWVKEGYEVVFCGRNEDSGNKIALENKETYERLIEPLYFPALNG